LRPKRAHLQDHPRKWERLKKSGNDP